MRESDRAYNAIMEQILVGRIRCGQTIDDDQLQEELHVGKTPLREALFRLIQDGYVTAVPHRGMFVTTFGVAELDSLLNLRLLLMGYLCEKLVQNARDKDIDACETRMRQSLPEEGKMTQEDVMRVDLTFHSMIRELCGDNILASTLQKLEYMSSIALIPHSREYYLNKETVKAEYFDTFTYLRERDKENLEKVLKRHIPKYVLQRN